MTEIKPPAEKTAPKPKKKGARKPPDPQAEHNRELARKGEACAARYLEMKGYEILAMNWRCPVGEMDIVARTRDAIVFVEVKTRMNTDKGFPEEAVTEAKRAKYERMALLFLQDFDAVEIALRFDVIGIIVMGPERAVIRHHVNAFGAA